MQIQKAKQTDQIGVEASRNVHIYVYLFVCAAAADGYLSYNDAVRTEKAISSALQELASLFN